MDEIQQKFDKLVFEGADLSFDNLVKPLCEELETKLTHDVSTWPIVYMKDRVVIYYELLFMRREQLNEQQELLLMTYRPLIYYLKLIRMTYSEHKKWRRHIKELIPEVFGQGFESERITNLREIMKISKKKIDMSPITFFHYFIGFKFSNKYIGLLHDELKSITGDTNIIYININVGCKRDVYTYRQVTERMGLKLLTIETAKKFHPISVTKLKDYPTKMITGIVAENNYIAINYDNIHYTLISNGDELVTYDKETTERFLDGCLPVNIGEEEYESYAKLMYQNEIPHFQSMTKIEVQLPDEAKIYNKYIRKLIDNYSPMDQNKYPQFVKAVADAIPDDAMDANEKKLFIYYLDMYSFLEFNVYEFVTYLWGYFNPSLLL